MHLLNSLSHAQQYTAADHWRSASIQALLRRVELFARDETAPILLQGESGTGKTLLARRIHDLSPRKSGPFQHVVLSTLEDGIAASDLFGHVAGAFTDAKHARAGQFVSANAGTLFLDEIGKSSRALQGKLLHAIEYHEVRPVGGDRSIRVDARIVAASNIDLEDLVESGEFLADLRARLATFRIVIPPLRERRADIPVLVRQAIDRHMKPCGYREVPPDVHETLMHALQKAPWPENLRQLDATVHRIMIEAEGAPILTLGHCTDELSYLATNRVGRSSVSVEQIAQALHQAGTISGAARMLGIDRKTLRSLRARSD